MSNSQQIKRAAAGLILALPAASGFAQGQSADSLDSILGPDTQGSTAAASPPAPPAAAPAAPNAAAPAAAPPQSAEAPPPAAPQADSTAAIAAPATAASTKKEYAARGTIEEIVVTSQKRSENLQAVPITIQAFTAADLAKQNVGSTQDLQYVTPSMVYSNTAGFTQAYIRGVGSDSYLPTADPSVATYVDGVYYPFVQSTIQSTAQVERIEVLKGPQGTLYGRNATGGAINVITRDPSHDAYEFNGEADYGNYNHTAENAYANLPVLKWLAVSAGASFDYTHSFDYQVNPTGPAIDATRDYAVRVKMAIDPLDALHIVVSGYKTHHFGTDSNLLEVRDAANIVGLPVGAATPANDTPHRIDSTSRGYNDLHTEGLTFKATYKTDWFNIVPITGYQFSNNVEYTDFNASSPLTVVSFDAVPNPDGSQARSFSQELQIVSNGPDWIDYIFGGYYFRDHAGFEDLSLHVLGNLLPDVLDPLLSTLNLSNAQTNTLLTNASTVELRGDENGDAYAGFGQATWHTLSWLDLTAGARYSTETRALIDSNVSLATVGGINSALPLIHQSGPPTTSNDFSPRLNVQVRPMEGVMLYATFAHGFKSGTWNTVNITNLPTYVLPETIIDYELGLKSDFLDRTLRFNLGSFLYHYHNLQVLRVAVLDGGTVTIENAPRSRIYGADAELTWLPIEGLTLSLNGGYLKANYTDYPEGSGFNQVTGLPEQADFSGHNIVRSPTASGNFQVEYSFTPFFGIPIDASVNEYHSSGYWFDAENTLRQKAYSTLGASVAATSPDGRFQVQGYGSNLTNTADLDAGVVYDLGKIVHYGAPRQYGVRFKLKFGG